MKDAQSHVPAIADVWSLDCQAELGDAVFNNQALVDIKALGVCAQIVNVVEAGGKLNGILRSEAAGLVRHVAKVSMRIRTHMRIQGRSAFNNADIAWEVLQETWPDGKPDCRSRAEAVATSAAGFRKTLTCMERIAKTDSIDAAVVQDAHYDMICEIAAEEEESEHWKAVFNFSAFCFDDDVGHIVSEADQAENLTLASKFISLVAKALELNMQKEMCYDAHVRCLIHGKA